MSYNNLNNIPGASTKDDYKAVPTSYGYRTNRTENISNVSEMTVKSPEVENVDLGSNVNPEELLNVAKDVINGKYGNGPDRKENVENLGYSYKEVQALVNELLGVSASESNYVESTSENVHNTEEVTNTIEVVNEEPNVIQESQVYYDSKPVNIDVLSTLNVTEEQLDVIKAVIRQEAGNNYEEMLNVASCIKNRMDKGNWGGGNNAYGVVTAKSQFSAYGYGHYLQYTNGNYFQGDDSLKEQVSNDIDAILMGTKPVTHNYESFRANGNGVRLSEKGNVYR